MFTHISQILQNTKSYNNTLGKIVKHGRGLRQGLFSSLYYRIKKDFHRLRAPHIWGLAKHCFLLRSLAHSPAYAGQKFQSKVLGVSTRTIIRDLSLLQQAKYIDIGRHRGARTRKTYRNRFGKVCHIRTNTYNLNQKKIPLLSP